MTRATLEFVGTATTVLRLGPFTLLTDPNFLHRGQRAYLGKGLFSKRVTEPSLQPADLPPLDVVLLSHCTATISTWTATAGSCRSRRCPGSTHPASPGTSSRR